MLFWEWPLVRFDASSSVKRQILALFLCAAKCAFGLFRFEHKMLRIIRSVWLEYVIHWVDISMHRNQPVGIDRISMWVISY